MVKKIRFLIVGIVMLLVIVLLIRKPHESEAESLLAYAKIMVEGQEIKQSNIMRSKHIFSLQKKTVSMIFGRSNCLCTGGLWNGGERVYVSKWERIQEQDDDFIKIYTYVLLNESLQYDERETEDFAENSQKALNYMAQSKEYRNNVDLCWRIASIFWKTKRITSKVPDF